MASEKPFLSVVVPVFNEELTIEKMYERVKKALEEDALTFEIIIVNDGSYDSTVEKVKRLCSIDNRVKLVSFSRNFGHQIAISAGLDKSRGQVVVIIDADLQDPPELIPKMIKMWENGCEVVYAVRKKRKGDSFFKRFTAALFYRTLRILSPVEIPLDAGDFRLLDRKVVDVLKRMRERSRFVRGMVSWIGFRQGKIEYVREKRIAGETKYPLRKMISFAIDGILSFSNLPLRLSSAFGFIAAVISFILLLYGIWIKVFYPSKTIPGWTSLFVVILFFSGIQLVCIGILGEYVGRANEECKKRPLYIVDEEVNFD
ncbi:MAG TPA: glycosyltransferase [Deltaproteobacteria bacterium]|nr:glycosyltransferase [Deltaproteobacteria bacterium]